MKNKILIVDDEDAIRTSLARHFRLEGFNVETAEDGRDAVRKLSRTPFSVVISDIMMPAMDGIDLLRHIRAECPMTRVIMITGHTTLDNALACMRLGAVTCVFKPLADLGELDSAVGTALAHLESWRKKLIELKGLKDE
jgi:DNA-binding NtrC family response regulator